jgi:hypothetical protein
MTAAVLDGGRRMFWTFSSSNRVCLRGCLRSGSAGLPVIGGLLHFPVFVVAAPVLAGPDVSRPVKRPCSRMTVTRTNRAAGRFRVTVAVP